MDSIKTFPKFTIFFVFLMLLEIAGLTIIPTFHMVSKALIMAGLIGFYIAVEKKQNNVFLTGLIFALLGDCFLLFNTDQFFLIGLTCFLIMQLCYTSAFNMKRRIPRNSDYIKSMGIALIGILILAFLWNILGALRWPVVLYILAILSMAIYAYLRHHLLRGYSIVLIGVILFILSDSILAFNRFGSEIPYANIIVMMTYMLAQYFIVTGEVLSNIPKKDTKIKTNSAFGRHKV